MYFNAEFRTEQTEGEAPVLEGYFVRTNAETELYPGVIEEIAKGALDESLKNNDVRCLFNHDSGIVLGRTGNGTLKLRTDEKGLFGSVQINQEDKQAMDIYARVKRGDINACSFGFYPEEEDTETLENGVVKFIVRKANLIEVSCVTFPAYPQTEINARKRSVEDFQKEQLNKRKKKLKEKINGVKTTNDY